jgi:predicted ATPase
VPAPRRLRHATQHSASLLPPRNKILDFGPRAEYSGLVLLGRERECGLLDRLLGEATDGRSSALLLRGEAGMGKSALLGYATERARGMAMTVLTARGREAEAELAFAGLADLLRPVLGGLEAIPAPQAAALAGALALGPAVPASRFTTGAATLSLLGVAAEERPLLATVDDAHLLDASSRDALLFAARRLKAEGVVLLLAVRSGDGAVIDAVDIPELTLGGLGPDAARALLAWSAGQDVPEELAQRLGLRRGGGLGRPPSG